MSKPTCDSLGQFGMRCARPPKHRGDCHEMPGAADSKHFWTNPRPAPARTKPRPTVADIERLTRELADRDARLEAAYLVLHLATDDATRAQVNAMAIEVSALREHKWPPEVRAYATKLVADLGALCVPVVFAPAPSGSEVAPVIEDDDGEIS